MTDQAKLILAEIQLNNLLQLTEDNPWKEHLHKHLISAKVEIVRQIHGGK